MGSPVAGRRLQSVALLGAIGAMVGAMVGVTAACGGAPVASPAPPPPAAVRPADQPPARLTARVLATYPHAADAFTQGLLVHQGSLFESTGLYGASSLRQVEITTGRVLRRLDLPPSTFAEGLARSPQGELVQLTWQQGRALRWELETFKPRGEWTYAGEGWGLTSDGKELILSDGSAELSFRDAASFLETRRLTVTYEGAPIANLNELEWAQGALWANVWQQDVILRIDPASGQVTAVVDLSALASPAERRTWPGADVLNGIAWWPEQQAFLVTGKHWPKLYQVVFE